MILFGVDLLLQVFSLRRSEGGRRELGQIRNLPAQESDLIVESFTIAIGHAGGLHSNGSSSALQGSRDRTPERLRCSNFADRSSASLVRAIEAVGLNSGWRESLREPISTNCSLFVLKFHDTPIRQRRSSPAVRPRSALAG